MDESEIPRPAELLANVHDAASFCEFVHHLARQAEHAEHARDRDEESPTHNPLLYDLPLGWENLKLSEFLDIFASQISGISEQALTWNKLSQSLYAAKILE